MYSTLDKVDIVVQDRDGGPRSYHQTDHRTAHEIAAEPEVSALFALTRVLNARAMGGPDAVVRYVCPEEPPHFLLDVVAAAGGEVEIGTGERRVLSHATAATPADLADEALRALAARVANEEGISLDRSGLARLEQRAWACSLAREEDEIDYWTTVVRLAAVCGEVLRARGAGRWRDDSREISLIPFLFADEGAFYNVFTKAEKSVESKEPESLVHLLVPIASGGPMMVSLKPRDWPGRDTAVHTTLLDLEEAPLLVYGLDQPDTFAILNREGETRPLDVLHAEALETLARVEVDVEQIDVGPLVIWVVGGDYWAAEKLLDPIFVNDLHRRVGSDLLAAGVPRRGMLMVTNGLVAPQIQAGFLAAVEGQYLRAPEREQICRGAFIVQQGRVVGAIRGGAPEDGPPVPEKKGFFARWFGRGGDA